MNQLIRPWFHSARVRRDGAGRISGADRARAAAAADAAFGADMYQLLAEDAADTVFSPASVASALRMALCGARGQTAAELARALHLRIGRLDRTRSAGCRWRRSGRAARPGPSTFRAPNTVWVQSGLPLRAEFTAALNEAAAMFATADFAARARGGADRDQPRDRRADRGQDHRIAAARRRRPADQAGARQRGVPEGGVDGAVPRRRDGRRAVLPGRPGPPGPDRAA